MNSFPLVTFCVICYNTGRYVLAALDSIKYQTYDNIELYIVDDCSTDNSVELLKRWIAQNDYECTLISHKENKGLHAGLNEILSVAKGKYISFLGDDLWVPEKTSEQVEILETAGNEYGVVYGDMDYIDEHSNPLHNTWFHDRFDSNYALPVGEIFRDVVNAAIFFAQASLYSLDILKKAGFKFNKDYISEDWHLNLYVTRYSKAIGTRKVYCHYRFRDDSVTAIHWAEGKMHTVLISHIAMFEEIYRISKNDDEDKKVIYNKIHSLALQLFHSVSVKRVTKVSVAFSLFLKKSNFKNILKCIMLLITGNLKMADKGNYVSLFKSDN